jgi:hypothetical protein
MIGYGARILNQLPGSRLQSPDFRRQGVGVAYACRDSWILVSVWVGVDEWRHREGKVGPVRERPNDIRSELGDFGVLAVNISQQC